MKRERRSEVIAKTRFRVALVVEELFHAGDPYFDDPEEQALAEATVARIAHSIDSRCGNTE